MQANITVSSKSIAKGSQRDMLWVLDTASQNDVGHETECFAYLEACYKRLRHIETDGMVKMASINVVAGLTIANYFTNGS